MRYNPLHPFLDPSLEQNTHFGPRLLCYGHKSHQEKNDDKNFLIALSIAIFAGFAFGQAQTANREQMRAKGENDLATRDVIHGYFDRLKQKEEWKSFFADDIDFYQLTSPIKHTTGKAAYVEATKRFYSTIVSVEVRDLIGLFSWTLLHAARNYHTAKREE